MGFLEDTLDKDQDYRTFMFKDDKDKTVSIQVSMKDLEMIFKGYRPRTMDYSYFKQIRSLLAKELQRYKKGTLFHLSKVNDYVWKEYEEKQGIHSHQRGNTYRKPKPEESQG